MDKASMIKQCFLVCWKYGLFASASFCEPKVDLGQINSDFHTACTKGDTDAASALLLQGAIWHLPSQVFLGHLDFLLNKFDRITRAPPRPQLARKSTTK